MYYTFVRIHQTLKVTPAMAAGVTDGLWEITDVVGLLEDWEKRQQEQDTAQHEWSYAPKGSALGHN